jgi:hypothetical protein
MSWMLKVMMLSHEQPLQPQQQQYQVEGVCENIHL